MSVFSCRELAVDWQIAPRTPVLTTVAGHSSLNYDDYPDTERGLQTTGFVTQYPNIPDELPGGSAVTAASTWTEVQNAFLALQPGEVLWLEDGTYDWSDKPATYHDFTNNNGATADQPIYLMARNKYGAVMTNASCSFRMNSQASIVCGLYFNSTCTGEGISARASYSRITSCKFECTAIVNPINHAWQADNSGPNNIEVDNCETDALATNDAFDNIVSITGIEDAPGVLGNPKHIRLHHLVLRNRPITVAGPRTITLNARTDYERPSQKVQYNTDAGRMYAHIENILLDAWMAEAESFSLKCDTTIFRNCTWQNGSEFSASRVRALGVHQFVGNWGNLLDSYNASAEKDCAAFNFFQMGTDSASNRAFRLNMRQRNDDPQGWISYQTQSESVYQHNVFSGFGKVLHAVANTVGLLDEGSPGGGGPLGVTLEGNHFYSALLAQNDTAANGNYDRAADAGNGQCVDETQFRADNTWGTNFYSNTTLPQETTGIDASAFDGPGDTFATTAQQQADWYGQPSQIPMPSWWKLP